MVCAAARAQRWAILATVLVLATLGAVGASPCSPGTSVNTTSVTSTASFGSLIGGILDRFLPGRPSQGPVPQINITIPTISLPPITLPRINVTLPGITIPAMNLTLPRFPTLPRINRTELRGVGNVSFDFPILRVGAVEYNLTARLPNLAAQLNASRINFTRINFTATPTPPLFPFLPWLGSRPGSVRLELPGLGSFSLPFANPFTVSFAFAAPALLPTPAPAGGPAALSSRGRALLRKLLARALL